MGTAPDRDHRFVELEWMGPIRVEPRGKGMSLVPPKLGATQVREKLKRPGLYYVLADHLVHGPNTLVYIGQASRLGFRLKEHKWLLDEWNVEVYIATASRHRDDIESLLIWAHHPSANASKIASSAVKDLRVWNTKRCPRLIPDVSSAHPWFQASHRPPSR